MIRGSKRLTFLTTLLVGLGIYMTLQYNNNHPPASSILCHATRSLDDYSHSDTSSSDLFSSLSSSPHSSLPSSSYYLNLNSLNATAQGHALGEHLLVLTPLTRPDDVIYLPEYLERLDRSTYPNELISIGLLLVDPAMRKAVEPIVQRYMRSTSGSWRQRSRPEFHAITVYERHMGMNSQDNTAYGRSLMARARNFLLSAALRDFHSWVAWVDVDIVNYPPTIFDDLMSANVDVIVPNCLLDRNDFWAYDRRNWQETDYSLETQKWVGEDFFIMEGVSDGASGRALLVDMPTHHGMEYKVPLDAVGATFTLVKSHVHREGANFPPFLYQHNIESEAFGKVANAMGFSVYGVPGYFVYHADRS